MKKVLLLCSIVALVVLGSCKKDKNQEIDSDSISQSLSNKKLNSVDQSLKNSVLRSPQQVEELTKSETKAFLKYLKKENFQNKASGCPRIESISYYLIGSTYNCSPSGGTTLTFLCNIYEYGSYNYVREFEWNTFGLNLPVNMLNEITTLLCPDWNPNQQSGECPRLIQYTFSIDNAPYGVGGEDGINLIAKTICGSAHGNPPPPPLINNQYFSFWSCGSLSECENSTLNSPPYVEFYTISVGSGIMRFVTPCSGPNVVLCYPPYLLCPSTISMEYRKLGTTNWISDDGFITGLEVGATYEYRNVVFYYTSPFVGNSLPSGSGTFIVP